MSAERSEFPFNELTSGEDERLAILAEECAEVIQAAMKIMRHGYESTNPKGGSDETNRQGLERELGDLGHAIKRMERAGDINAMEIQARSHSKGESIRRYLHHQPRLESTASADPNVVVTLSKEPSPTVFTELLNACTFVKSFLAKLEDGTSPDDPLRAVRKKFHAPLHAVLDSAISRASTSAALTAITEPSPSDLTDKKENV